MGAGHVDGPREHICYSGGAGVGEPGHEKTAVRGERCCLGGK